MLGQNDSFLKGNKEFPKNTIPKIQLYFQTWHFEITFLLSKEYQFSRVLIFENWLYFEFSRELILRGCRPLIKKRNFINFAVHDKPAMDN